MITNKAYIPIDGEILNPIPGYGDRYLVSNLGRIISKVGPVWKVRRTVRAWKGYRKVTLCDPGPPLKKKTFLVHRLVAQAFIPNPMGLPEVNHLDGVTDHNSAINLEWCTHRQNQEDAIRRHGGWWLADKNVNHEKSYRPIHRIDPYDFTITSYPSMAAAIAELKLETPYRTACPNISNAADKPKLSYGFLWSRRPTTPNTDNPGEYIRSLSPHRRSPLGHILKTLDRQNRAPQIG